MTSLYPTYISNVPHAPSHVAPLCAPSMPLLHPPDPPVYPRWPCSLFLVPIW